MFVRDFIHVAQPFESVAPCFVTDAGWLTTVAEHAAVSARELSARLRPGDPAAGDGLFAAASVHCDTGPVRVRRDSLVVPLHIVADDATDVPPLDADLEVSPLGPGLCQLTLNATYPRVAPPGTDDGLAQRTAEVVARYFLQAVAERITGADRDS